MAFKGPANMTYSIDKHANYGAKMRFSSKLIAAIVFVGAASSTALAADMAVKAPRMVEAAPYNWNGFYAGVHVGYGWASDSVTATIANTGQLFTTFSNPASGVFGGVQGGYNWVVAPSFLLGIEADISASDVKGDTFVPTAPGTSELRTKADYFGTVRGRAGFIANNTWLLYATGGYAWLHATGTNLQATCNTGACFANSPPGTALPFTQNRDGWTVGAGVEVAFAPRWTAKFEYLYMDFGSRTMSLVPVFNRISTDSLTMNTVKAGINYQFGGPVVARY
jgi:outer membrane immunogenic protein